MAYLPAEQNNPGMLYLSGNITFASDGYTAVAPLPSGISSVSHPATGTYRINLTSPAFQLNASQLIPILANAASPNNLQTVVDSSTVGASATPYVQFRFMTIGSSPANHDLPASTVCQVKLELKKSGI